MATGVTTMITMATVRTMTIMMTTVRRGAAMVVLKTEPVVMAEVAETAEAAEAAEAAGAAAVATTRADKNQQRATKMAAAEIAVGKRRQAGGEKQGRWHGRRQQRGRRRRRQGRWRWHRWPVGRGRM